MQKFDIFHLYSVNGQQPNSATNIRRQGRKGMITLSVHWTGWRPVTHALTWASYSVVYRLGCRPFSHHSHPNPNPNPNLTLP